MYMENGEMALSRSEAEFQLKLCTMLLYKSLHLSKINMEVEFDKS